MMRSHPIMPFAAAAAGIALFSLMDATMKHVSIQVGVYTSLQFRCLISTALVLPIWWVGKRAHPGRNHPKRHLNRHWPNKAALKVHATRSAVVTCMALMFFWGLVRIPMAEAIALSFIAPLIALYMAAVLLGERIERRAVIASLMGLGGVVVIAADRLGREGIDGQSGWGIAAILASAVLYAWNLILQRQQAKVAHPSEIALFQSALMALFLLPAAPWFATWPTADELLDISAAAWLAVISLMLLSWGYARAEAQALVPIEYSSFIWASLMGWLWFREPVSPATLIGVVLIVIGCLIAARKRTEITAL